VEVKLVGQLGEGSIGKAKVKWSTKGDEIDQHLGSHYLRSQRK